MEDMINSIWDSLRADNIRPALAVSLTLPDICGRVNYSVKGLPIRDNEVGKRYIEWFNEYVSLKYYNMNKFFLDDKEKV